MTPIVGVHLADSQDPPKGHDLRVALVERKRADDEGWYLAGACLRSEDREWWLDDNPGGGFEYWWEHDGNGYSTATFHYYATNEDAVAQLVGLRREELASGITPYPASPMPPETHSVTDGLIVQAPDGRRSIAEETYEGDGQLVGEDEGHHLNRSHAVSLALVWRLAAELTRRHPTRLWVYPEGGGMYDRVTVVDLAADPVDWVITLNASGSNSSINGGELLSWAAAFLDGADPAEWVREAERLTGLPSATTPLPPSTPASLAVRLVAVFLTLQLGSRKAWSPRSLHHFASDGGWYRDWITTWERASGRSPSELTFLCQAGVREPDFVVSSTGDLRRRDGQHFNLAQCHRPGKSMTELLLRTVPDLLP